MESKNKKSNGKCEAKILGVCFTSTDRAALLYKINQRIKRGERTVIFTPNPQILLKASRDSELKKALSSASFNIPDGIGVIWASRLLGCPLKERISGIDLGEDILKLAERHSYSVFLLGGKSGVARKAARELQRRYDDLRICGTHHGYFEDSERITDLVSKLRPDIILVCLGSPKQEKWIINNLSAIPSVRLAMGLGGSLDVWSGKTKRAPNAFRSLGLEWLWRTIREPKRARIFADIPHFLFCVIKQKASRKKRNADIS